MRIKDRYQKLLRTVTDITEHLPVLRNYAEQCDRVVELGVRGMVSTWAFLAAHPSSLTSVDSEHPSKWGQDVEEVKKIAVEEGIVFDFIQADDLKIVLPETDLLFIDTLHTYGQLKQELTLHASKSSRFIILHDTNSFGITGENGAEGLDKALYEFLTASDGSGWRMKERWSNCNGLTVLAHK